MNLSFTKMHGLGNDFVVLDNTASSIYLTPELVSSLAHRKFSIGFDQLLVVEKSSVENADFDYRIFNADGSEVEHCGNGARCFAQFVREKQLTSKQTIRVNTQGGIITLIVRDDNLVTVEMGIPEFNPIQVPFIADNFSTSYTLQLNEQSIDIGVVSIGNPHAVTVVDDVQLTGVELLGQQIGTHSRFPNRVNAGFMQIVDSSHINLRVYERGVGETLACGTGACAAVIIGIIQGRLEERVKVNLAGGVLEIYWPGQGQTVTLTGPCTTVFEGNIKT